MCTLLPSLKRPVPGEPPRKAVKLKQTFHYSITTSTEAASGPAEWPASEADNWGCIRSLRVSSWRPYR